jgi:cysteine desulfurase
MAPMLYLDHAATTVMRPEARAAMEPFLDTEFGNPSGVHEVSREAKNAVEEARERAAALIGAQRPLEIVFTGGGTEADNLAVAGAALAEGKRGGVVTTAIEHEAVLETARFCGRLGCPVEEVGVDGKARVSPDDLVAALTAETAVVSVMLANNETGVIQPVRKIAEAVKGRREDVVVHTDAVQALTSEPVTVDETGADLIALAAHKFGGPKGTGLLYVRDGVALEPVVHGGGQELGRRSGTQNVAGIVGMVAAMEATVADRAGFRRRVGEARDRFEAGLRRAFPDIEVNAPADSRLAQHAHLRIPGVASETLLVRLDQAGIAAAAGSACHSGAIEVSHVLAAMGMGPVQAAECVRFSFGWVNTPDDGDVAAERVVSVVEALR